MSWPTRYGTDGPFHGKKHTTESRAKISASLKGRKVWNKGLKLGPNLKASEALKGRTVWNKGKSGYKNSRTEESNKNMGRGPSHYLWIEDRSQLKKQNRRNDSAYKEWRITVYKRDGFKCKIGNADCGGRLEAHHILAWAEFPELRYQPNNGITLCRSHHPKRKADALVQSPYFQELVGEVN